MIIHGQENTKPSVFLNILKWPMRLQSCGIHVYEGSISTPARCIRMKTKRLSSMGQMKLNIMVYVNDLTYFV